MDNKKTLLNQKINVEDLEKVSKIITKKALKVISCSGSIYAIKLLENRDVDILEDLKQEVALQIILDNYVITRNSYKVVRSYIYRNYEKTEVEIFTSEENQEQKENQASYISYLSNSNEKSKKCSKLNVKKLFKLLSETEKEIYKYYYINNMKQCELSKMTGTSKQNVNKLIRKIKQKAVLCVEV